MDHHVHLFHNMMVLNGLFTLHESKHKNHNLQFYYFLYLGVKLSIVLLLRWLVF